MRRGYRTCKKCGVAKRRSAFPIEGRKHGSKQAKTSGVCRLCQRRIDRDREKQLARWARYGRDCPRCGKRVAFPGDIGVSHNAICRECRRERHRASQKALRDANPGLNAAYCKRWRESNPESYRAAYAAWRAKRREYLKEHPEVREELLELRRISDKARRMEQGAKPRVASPIGNGGDFISAAPLARAVAAYQAMNPWFTELELGERIGVSDKTLREWRQGKRKSVHEDLADVVMTRMGWNWFDVYQPPPNGHPYGRPQDVLRYIDDVVDYLKTVKAFTGEETLDYA